LFTAWKLWIKYQSRKSSPAAGGGVQQKVFSVCWGVGGEYWMFSWNKRGKAQSMFCWCDGKKYDFQQ